jgi:DNA-binding GntR family transcriptional regulator
MPTSQAGQSAARHSGTGPARVGPAQGEQPRAGEAARAHALAAVRQAILSGDVAPGQRLVEEELAAQLHVTRASLRAALLELTNDGLVERVHNRGARVRIVTTEEAVAITECRMALDALCAVKAAERVTDEQIAGLRDLGARLRRAVDDGDALKYSQTNAELHRTVRAISGQTVAVDLLERLNAQLVRHQFQLALRPGRPEHSLGEHLAIIDAIRRRDPVAADQATRRHLTSVIDALRAPSAPAPGTAAEEH